MSFNWLAPTLQARRGVSDRRRREQTRRRRIALEPLEDRTVMSTFTWTGADGLNWSTPGNWDVGGVPASSVPGSSDDVVFEGTVATNSNVDVNFNVKSVTILKNYHRTVNLGANLTVGGDFAQAGGTVEANGATMTLGGSFATSGGTFNADSGTVVFALMGGFGSRTIDTGSSAGFNNVELASGSGSTLTINQMIVNGALTITKVGTISGTIHARGDVSTSDTSITPSSGTLVFDGAGPQTLKATAPRSASSPYWYASVPGVTINKPGGTLTLDSTNAIGVTGDWNYVKGGVTTTGSTVAVQGYSDPVVTSVTTKGAGSRMAFNNLIIYKGSGDTLTVPAGQPLTVNGSLTIDQVGVLTADLGAITVGGDLTSNDDYIGGGTNITMNTAANASITGGDFPSGGIIVSKLSGSVVTANVLTPLRGPLTLNNLAALTGTFHVAGDVTSNDTSITGNVDGPPVLVFDGNGAQTLTAGVANAMVPGLEFNKTSGSFGLANNANVTGSNALNLSGGWIVDGSNTQAVATNGANVKFMLAGGFGSRTIDTGTTAGFDNVELATGSGSALTVNTMVVNGLLNLTNVGVITGTIQARKDVSTSDQSVSGGTILFNGTGGQTLSATADYASVPSVAINKPSGGALAFDSAHKIGVTGDWTFLSGAVLNANSTIAFRSYSNITIDTGSNVRMAFNNVEIAKGSGDTLTVPAGRFLNVTGALTINQIGRINADLGAVQVAGDLTSNDPVVGGTADVTMVSVDNLTPSPATLKGGGFPDGGIVVAKYPGATVTLGSDLAGLKKLIVFLGTLDLQDHVIQVNGPMIVQSGATLAFAAPSNGGTQLTVNGNMTFAAESTLAVDLTAYTGGAYDLITVIGAGHSLVDGGAVESVSGGGTLSWTTGPNGKVRVTK